MIERIEVVGKEGSHHVSSIGVPLNTGNAKPTCTFDLDLDDLKLIFLSGLLLHALSYHTISLLLRPKILALLIPLDCLVEGLTWTHLVKDLSDAGRCLLISRVVRGSVHDILRLETVVLLEQLAKRQFG